MAKRGDYETYKAGQAEISRERSAAGREIGGIPPIANVRRRARCRKSLRAFCETYNPAAFALGWSSDHLTAINRIEEAATQGALYAFAMARGSGKTTVCRMAALWAISYHHCRYAYVIGATDDKARETLDTLRVMIRFLEDYAADFPEISYPAQRLGGIANRSSGQTCGGESTLIEWSADRIVLPTVPPPENWPRSWELRDDGKVPTAGCLVSASGLTGEGLRGSLKTLSSGEMVRPDFVLLDDPQTPESSRSRTQNVTRLKLITADVLGMAGPGKAIAAVMPCTVIERGDMVDEVLDRSKHPLWRGERSGILKAMPSDLSAWDGYFEEYARCAQLEPPDFASSNAYYKAHQPTLEAGAVATWDARKLDGEVSAIQHAMHLYFRDRRAFFAEYMNDPLEENLANQLPDLDATLLASRLNRSERYFVPPELTRLTAFVDVGLKVCWWCVCGWGEGYASGAVVDYGVYPGQTRAYFAASDARPTLADTHPTFEETALIYAGLKAVTDHILGRAYPTAASGDRRVATCLIDAGKWTDTVHQFIRQSPHSVVLFASKGYGIGAGAAPMASWAKRPGERRGDGWVQRAETTSGRDRTVVFDSNQWKSFAARRLLAPVGGQGVLQLFGTDPRSHALFADHLTAEYRILTEGRGRQVEEWKARPNRDNHWWDCLVGNCVAASVAGLTWSAGTAAGMPPVRKSAPARKPTLGERIAAKEQAGTVANPYPGLIDLEAAL